MDRGPIEHPRPILECGHLLGSASIELEFSGEGHAGNRCEFLRPEISSDAKLFQTSPEAPTGFDYVIRKPPTAIRERPSITPQSRRESLAAESLSGADGETGALLIPAFAVERTQELIVDLVDLMQRGRISDGTDLSRFRPWPFAPPRFFANMRRNSAPISISRRFSPLSESAFHRDCQRKQGDRKSFLDSTSSLPRAACAMPAGSATISSVGLESESNGSAGPASRRAARWDGS